MDLRRAGENGFQQLPHLGAGQQKLIGGVAMLLMDVKQSSLGTLETRFGFCSIGFCSIGFCPMACASVLSRVHVLPFQRFRFMPPATQPAAIAPTTRTHAVTLTNANAKATTFNNSPKRYCRVTDRT